MASHCVVCGKAIEAGDYRLVGVMNGSWESCYAHRGHCEAEARERFAPKVKPTAKRRSRTAPPQPEVVELSIDDPPDPIPDDTLPWFGMERRR